ncbi:MAG: recombinase family protein [Stellaceae bacterium]
MTVCIAYLRTSSATNVGQDKDSERRQRAAIEAFAERAGLAVAREFNDAAVSGADALAARPGFAALLSWAAENDVRTIIVENASRFARDLIVQEVGYRMLKDQGFTLIAADDPDAFTADTPTAVMVRQILGAVAEFDRAQTVAKLKGARERASAALGVNCAGRGRSYQAGRPELVAAAKELADGRTLREVSAALCERGYMTAGGKPFSPSQVQRLVA